METIIPLSMVFIVLAIMAKGYVSFQNFIRKYEIVILDKEEDLEQEDEEVTALDLRGRPTHVCVCGSQVWLVKVVFQEYEIATYFLDMYCAECGNLATAPTPLDREESEN